METYYKLLEIPVAATADEVAAAYQRQRERYSPERVAALGDEFRSIAEARTGELERAYSALMDSRRRQNHDRGIGISAGRVVGRAPGRTRLTRRELALAIGSAMTGLLVIAFVWVLAGRSAQPELPPVAETHRPAPEFRCPVWTAQTCD